MKKFIYFIALSLLLLFTGDWILTLIGDHLYSEIKTGQTGGKINYYLSRSTPEIVIMGNSRAFYQIIPDSFRRSVFSLGHAGQTQIFQTGLLKIMEDNSKLPQILLLHVEPEEFIGSAPHNNIQNLKYYYGKEPFITDKLNALSRFERFKFLFGLYRYNGRIIPLIKNFIQTKRSFHENNGYEPVLPSPRDRINTIYSANKITDDESLHFNIRQADYLMEYISICKKNNVQLICFTSPLFRVSVQEQSASLSLDSLLKVNQVAYINFLNTPIPALQINPAYWKDAEHLNHDGAKIESEILADEIERVLEAKKQ